MPFITNVSRFDITQGWHEDAGYDLVTCKKYSFQQMYGKFNEILEDGDFKKDAEWIVDKMNSSAKIQSNETQIGKEVEYV